MLAFVIFALSLYLVREHNPISLFLLQYGVLARVTLHFVQKTVSTTEMLQNVHLVALTMVMQHYVENFASITEMLHVIEVIVFASCQQTCSITGNSDTCTENCINTGSSGGCIGSFWNGASICLTNIDANPSCDSECWGLGDAPNCQWDCFNEGDANSCQNACWNNGKALSCTNGCNNIGDADNC